MENNSSNKQKWFDKTWLVILLCIIFFPIGLYALWKNHFISKGWKIGVTIFIGIIVIFNLGNGSDGSSSTTSPEKTTEIANSSTSKNNTHSNDIKKDKPAPYEIMEVAFEGNPSKSEIQPMMEAVMKRYNMAITDTNLLRVANMLVVLRKESRSY